MFSPEQALSYLKGLGDWHALRHVKHRSHLLSFRDKNPGAFQTRLDEGVMIEVMHNGQFAYAATSDLSKEGILRAAEKALNLAQLASEHRLHPFTENTRRTAKGSYQSPVLHPFTKDRLSALQSMLQEATEKLKVSDQIITTMASVMIDDVSSSFYSSNGSEIVQNYTGAARSLSATAQKGSLTQTRTESGKYARSLQGGAELFDSSEVFEQAHRTGLEAIELLDAEECPTDTVDLILMPDQMLLQIHESIGHPLELDRILGDERNFAGWSFVRPEDFGQLQYGSNLMNVSFDPGDFSQYASYAFDDTGNPATKEYLIKEGVLLRGLGGAESQARLGFEGVANARSQSWNRAPIDRMANINLEPGESRLDEMISQTERGVLMHSNRSWSIDDVRNKFQFGCEYAKLIEDGRITKTLRNPNYRGSTLAFWNSLVQVGNKDTYENYGSPFCGKGEPNQIIRVAHASPICRFKNIEVFGGV